MRRVGMGELLQSPALLSELAGVLRSGGLVGLPTETFYALATDPASPAGVRRALEAKHRDDGKPLLVLFARREQLGALGIAPEAPALDRFFALWPAALTAVFPSERPLPASRGTNTLAVRMPAHPDLLALLSRVGPVTGTSLNAAGQPPCETAEDAAERFAGTLDLLVDGGRTPGGLASTLVDATVEPPRVVRKGAFPWPEDGP